MFDRETLCDAPELGEVAEEDRRWCPRPLEDAPAYNDIMR
jgi:hypothetical protein